MMSLSEEENNRLNALASYNILDTASEEDYDELTELAAAICGTPIALISLVDAGRQWFKSHKGLNVTETERSQSFCAHAILNPGEIMQVEDAHLDERFKNNPLVTGAPYITFYAGVPLVDKDGHALGSLCVIDSSTHQLTQTQQKALRIFAKQVVTKLELRRNNIELEKKTNEYRETAQTLRLSQQRLNRMIQTSPVGMCILHGRDMVIQMANTPMLTTWHKKEEEVVGKKLLDAFPELNGQPYPDWLISVFDTGQPVHTTEIPGRLACPDGNFRTVYTTSSYVPLFDEDGTVESLLITAVDMTGQKEDRLAIEQLNTELQAANAQLHESEENLRLTIEAARLGTYSLNLVTGEVSLNEYCREIFGFTSTKVSAKEGFNMMEEDKAKVHQSMNDAIASDTVFNMEYRIIRQPDGAERWVRSVGKAVKREGQPPRFYGIMDDITDHKLDEQRRGDFIGMVSHEMRNPLTSINGYLQILNLKAQSANNTFEADLIAKSLKQVEKMKALIKGFLDAARAGEGKIQLNCKLFDMATLIKAAESESLATITSHTIIYHPVEFTAVNADADKIEQVIINFVNNAVKYSPNGTTINVACISRDGHVHVSVTDEGMGIPLKDQPRIFDRFYRVDNDSMKQVTGFGIGLYICKEIITHHGGQIGVESVEGKGSTFWFNLPLHLSASSAIGS